MNDGERMTPCPVCRKEHSPYCCAWCGKEPSKQISEFMGNMGYDYGCRNPKCNFDFEWICLHLWDRLQTAIIAQRRKDFEAGRHVVVNPINGQSLSTFDDYLTQREARK